MTKFKVGDKVRVKSIEWYNKNKDECGAVFDEYSNERNASFIANMAKYCGNVLTIAFINQHGQYIMEDIDEWYWKDYMLEDETVQLTPIKTPSIDLTEILKGCEGVELYSPICGKCKLDRIEIGNNNYPIIISHEGGSRFYTFTNEGKYTNASSGAEVILFPSKDQRDWSKFKKPLPKLPVDTPCMVYTPYDSWSLRFYAGNGICFQDGKRNDDNVGGVTWDYIIPVEKFNFNNPESNFKSEWNYGRCK